MFANRILRFALIAIVVVVLAVAGVIGALFYRVNADSVKKTVEDLSAKALGATVVFDGPVEVTRMSSMQVKLPAMTFVANDEAQTVIGRVAGIDAEVSLWLLALGAVQVQSAVVNGFEGKLSVPQLSGNALFDSTFANINFPDDLRIQAVTFKNAKVDLDVTAHATRYGYRLTDLFVSMGNFSPEVTTPFEISAHFEPIAAAETQTSEAPAAAPAEPQQSTETPAAEPIQEPAVEPNAESAAQPAGTPTEAPAAAASEAAPIEAPAASTAPVESAPEHEAGQNASEPTPAVESAPAESSGTDTTNGPAASGSEQQSSQPAAETPAGQTVSLYQLLGINESYAAAPDFIQNEALFLSFDPKTSSGAFSAKGTLTISSLDRYVVFEGVNFSGETTIAGEPFTVVATADRVRFKDEEVSGTNVTASLSRPAQTSGDIHLGAVDFRIRPNVFESPELRLSYAKTDDARTTTLEVTSSVKADLAGQKTDLENFSSRVTVTGDKTLPADFSASLSGFVHVDHAADSAKAGLSGSFANAPFSYNGTVTHLNHPKFTGELMIGEINTATVPAFQSLDWMHKIDFVGTLRVGQILWRSLSATQLHCDLALRNGSAVLTQMIVNTADGRVMGNGWFNEDTSWQFDGKVDGVSLSKILTGFETSPIVSGVASGPLTLAGTGYDAQTLKGRSQVRVLRAGYNGIDAQAVRSFVTGQGSQEAVFRQGATTALDEVTARIDIEGTTMTISDIAARAVSLRTQAQAQVNLATGEIAAKVTNTYPPMHGIPSVHITADVTGAAGAPQWNFGWDQANSALRRAQGKSAVEVAKPAPSTDKKKEDDRSLWQSVRDFFSF